MSDFDFGIDSEEMFELMQDPEKHYTIDDDFKAEQALRKIKQIKEDSSRIKESCKRQIEFYQDRFDDIDRREQRQTEYLRALLRDYHESGIKLRETKSGQAIYDLAGGKLVRKHLPPKFVYDDQALLDWAKANAPQHVKTKETVAWGEIKKGISVADDGSVIIAKTGETLPVTAEKQDDVFVVEVI